VRIVLVDRDRAAGEPDATSLRAMSCFAARHQRNRTNTSDAFHCGRALTWEMAARLAEDLSDGWATA
jgi:hypothetical protein